MSRRENLGDFFGQTSDISACEKSEGNSIPIREKQKKTKEKVTTKSSKKEARPEEEGKKEASKQQKQGRRTVSFTITRTLASCTRIVAVVVVAAAAVPARVAPTKVSVVQECSLRSC